jgi:hypothetical protein
MVAIDFVQLLVERAQDTKSLSAPPGFSFMPSELPPPPIDFSAYPTSDLQQAAAFMLVLFPALSLVIVLARIHTRITTKTFGLDDWFIVAAMVCGLRA